MQLFGLVNALLSHNSRTVAANQSDFSIQRYAVMPLSPTAGECCVLCVLYLMIIASTVLSGRVSHYCRMCMHCAVHPQCHPCPHYRTLLACSAFKPHHSTLLPPHTTSTLSTGLISWVPNCDTLHDLIRSYRESRKIMLDVENKLILQVAPAKMYDSLPVMHKLEVSVVYCGVVCVLFSFLHSQ